MGTLKKILYINFLIMLFLNSNLFANCQGCCRNHGGVVCLQKVTFCQDRTSLSQKCQDKKCNMCIRPTKKISVKNKNKNERNAYHRKHFPHWTDYDSDCQTTRAEYLIKKNLGLLTFKKSKRCTVDSGLWVDFFTNEVLYKASLIDIDHIVPLKHAWKNGASQWTRLERKTFANDFENLVITHLKYNRQKQNKSILEWLPRKHFLACRYIKKWIEVKNKYQLSMSKKEMEYIEISNCNLAPL